MLGRTVNSLISALCVLLLIATPATAEIIRFEIALSGAEQVPPADTEGTGVLTAEFDTRTRQFSWTVRYDSLTGPPTAAHFHGPAEAGFNGPVALPIDPPLNDPLVGQAILSLELTGYLLDGLLYINIHSAAFPGGEIRGQLVPMDSSAAAE